MQKTVFVVDDNAVNLAVARESLKGQYRVRTLPSAAKMFEMLEKSTPDLILLDIEMPEMDGFQALSKLKDSAPTADVPVIFLTSITDEDTEARGFQMGVIDFINKPFSVPVLLNRIKTHLDLDDIIKERTAQLQSLQNALIHTLADIVESRDKGTGGHIERTAQYTSILLEEMLAQGVYASELRAVDMEQLISSARLHDLGKVGVADAVLNKPGKLSSEEFAEMKTHCETGEKFIESIMERSGDAHLLLYAKQIAGSHHERWDGNGYPRGLSGHDIPLPGRIAAVVDVFDALVSARPYKKGFPPEEAIAIISENSGAQFDPAIVEAFIKSKERFIGIYDGE